METLRAFLEQPFVEPTLIVAASIGLAYLVELVIRRTLVVMASKTATDLDDHIIEALRRPIFLSVIFGGLGFATASVGLEDPGRFVVMAGLKTFAVVTWTTAVMRIGSMVIHSLGNASRRGSVLQPRTIPVFDMLMKIVVLVVAIYFVFVAWHVDLTAWLASAGILGIAVGFAAKDSLGNLFAGLSILADGPYKLGDWIVVDGTVRGELRGKVTHIGIRSTRVLTMDDVEITVPNSLIANAQLINENGGPDPKQRVEIAVDVAYGSDVDRVRKVLLECAAAEPLAENTPSPQVRFRRFGGSGLEFQLFVWLEDAYSRALLIDRLNVAVYKAFAANDIEIPYSKHDVYIKQMPPGRLPE
ncbi:mechanosensitive ion channel family protein [Paraliomyxa miuraensis]|uniref:mechanosensitive ion channel family protein n=1 Tax=Paraliomyxa miuraensis TaxID=376150 RepID=UPI00224E2C56|nr:mechanosensitive ion channel family protein [Paraliomyxa miuraensis]MCX4240812.1 mechanosensitive ion channel family protein [Paraliomyxa miuraensis]